MKTKIMNLFRMMEKSGEMGKSLKSLMQIFATYASAIFVGKESCKSTVRYALWSRISLIKPLQNPYLPLTRFRLSLGSNLSRSRSACAPRTPSLFKDKSQLSFPSLASLICLCMLTVGVGNAWGAETLYVTLTMADNGSDSNTAFTNSTSIDADFATPSDSIKAITSVSRVYPGNSGWKFGGSSNAGSITISLAHTIKKVTKIEVSVKRWTTKNVNLNCNSIGAQTVNSSSYSTKTYTYATATDVSSITLATTKPSSGDYRCYINSIKIYYDKPAAAATTVTASPSSIAFPDNTVEVGTDEATSTITLSNGYASYGNYLYGWFEDLSDEDHCEFFVNDGSTYSYSTSGSATPTLTFSYLADAAGTFTGKFIIQGYNSSYTAVNCTIPLSVTLTSSCANSVTIETGTPTNCTISASAASVSTCSGTRQVTISVTPNSCYAAPVKASVTSTGTTATWVSGPTLNSDHYDYVYSFAENATGSTTFNCSLSTKTTYTVQYAQGDVPSGGGSISGSHVNDTKTCGDAMDLPAASFTTTGYTQTGWSKTNGGSQYAAVGGSYTDNAAQTFYPVWTANKYTVTWSVNGSTYTTTANVSYNTTTSTPANPSVPGECTGSTFMGWTATQNYTGDSAPGNMFNGTSPTITGDITFYAVFADED